MVDIDKLDKDKRGSGGSSKKKSSKSKSKSTTTQASGDAEPYTQDRDELINPEGKEVGRVAKEWADEGAELNYTAGSSGTLGQFEQQQIKEVKELHDDVYQTSKDNMGNFDEFTIYFHALMINFARNRVGIAKTLQKEFNMSKEEALSKTDEICKKAGEDKMMSKLVNEVTRNLADI